MPLVQIGCKLPHGLVLEHVTPGIGRNPAPAGQRVILKGANSLRPKGVRASVGQLPYAVTAVDQGFWEKWLEANKDLSFVKNGQVFVAKDESAAKAIMREREKVETGLEALKQEGDPRVKGAMPDPELMKRLRAGAGDSEAA